ncbi:response regulator transcription factor [soil metagenome]
MASDDEKPVRLLLVGHHEVVRTGLREFIRPRNIEIVGECSTTAEAVADAVRLQPDIVLMEVTMPDGSGLQACRTILAAAPNVRVLFWTDLDDDEARLASIFAGAVGYLLKEVGATTLLSAIENVAAGRAILEPVSMPMPLKPLRSDSIPGTSAKALSPQEQRILFLVAEGKTNKEIGQALSLSAKTVKNYLSNVFQKLHVTRRSQAAVLFKQLISK